jgi:protein required for attachment to host cells
VRAKRTWIFIGDGQRARIVANDGPGTGLMPLPKRTFSHRAPPTHEIGTERPAIRGGRGLQRHGVATRVDWHRAAKQEFAGRMAEVLNHAAERKDYDRLVVVAPPETLGEIRRGLSRAARSLVIAAIGKDLTQIPDAEIPDHLGGAVIF